MNELLSSFRTYLLEHRRAERSAEAYTGDVARYIAWCEKEYQQPFSIAMLNRSDLVDYHTANRKLDPVKAATWNRYVASLSIFIAWLIEIGELEDSPIDALCPAKKQKLAPKSLSKPDYRRFRLAVSEAVRTADTPTAKWQALRNAAIITLLADGGLREGEIVHLRPRDLVLGCRKGHVIILDGKGDKDRTVPLDYDSVCILKAWLGVRGQPKADELFWGKRGDRLQERGIQKLVTILAAQARIDAQVTPHVLRHSAAYRLLKAGANLNEVAEFLGHASIETTRRYTLPHYEDLEELVEAM
jgi:site-specific recombinase XerD